MPLDHECPTANPHCPVCNPSPEVERWATELFQEAYGRINDCDFGPDAEYEFIKDCSHDMFADMCADRGVPRELIQQVAQCLNSRIN